MGSLLLTLLLSIDSITLVHFRYPITNARCSGSTILTFIPGGYACQSGLLAHYLSSDIGRKLRRVCCLTYRYRGSSEPRLRRIRTSALRSAVIVSLSWRCRSSSWDLRNSSPMWAYWFFLIYLTICSSNLIIPATLTDALYYRLGRLPLSVPAADVGYCNSRVRLSYVQDHPWLQLPAPQ